MESSASNTTTPSAGSPEAFSQLLSLIASGFADPVPIEADFQVLYPGRDWRDPDFIGAGATLHELYMANVEGFVTEVVDRQDSRFYQLQSISRAVNRYLQQFDVQPCGPDLLKYTLGFGLCFDAYMADRAERPIVRMLGRMRTIRLMNAAAGLTRSDQQGPPVVMVRKVLRIWQDVDGRDGLLGRYGTYMVFKTWSLG